MTKHNRYREAFKNTHGYYPCPPRSSIWENVKSYTFSILFIYAATAAINRLLKWI